MLVLENDVIMQRIKKQKLITLLYFMLSFMIILYIFVQTNIFVEFCELYIYRDMIKTLKHV